MFWVSLWDLRQIPQCLYSLCCAWGVLIQLAACERSQLQTQLKPALLGPVFIVWIFGVKEALKTYLVINEAYVSGEYGGHPVAAQLDIDVLRQLLQRGQVVGLEVIGQRHVELLLVGLHVNICNEKTAVNK